MAQGRFHNKNAFYSGVCPNQGEGGVGVILKFRGSKETRNLIPDLINHEI